MSALPKPFITPQEYLRRERAAPFRSEYYNGEMFAMAGVSPPHVRINNNLVGELHGQFKGGPCYTASNDLKVKVDETGLYTYPDTIIVCEDMQIEDSDVLLNPKIIFEILSPSTESYDRGKKFEHYRTIPSLLEYILVSQTEASVDQFVRQHDNKWLLTAYTGLDAVLELATVPAKVALADLYHGVRFPTLSLYAEPAE